MKKKNDNPEENSGIAFTSKSNFMRDIEKVQMVYGPPPDLRERLLAKNGKDDLKPEIPFSFDASDDDIPDKDATEKDSEKKE